MFCHTFVRFLFGYARRCPPSRLVHKKSLSIRNINEAALQIILKSVRIKYSLFIYIGAADTLECERSVVKKVAPEVLMNVHSHKTYEKTVSLFSDEDKSSFYNNSILVNLESEGLDVDDNKELNQKENRCHSEEYDVNHRNTYHVSKHNRKSYTANDRQYAPELQSDECALLSNV